MFVCSWKIIINVIMLLKWKVKKQKLVEKVVWEVELVVKKVQVRQVLFIYLNLFMLDDVVNILKFWWLGLFDGDMFWFLVCGIWDVLLEDVVQWNILFLYKKLCRVLKVIICLES